MSAFIVDKAHIDALVAAGLMGDYGCKLTWANEEGAYDGSRKLDHTTADRVGRMLWAENVISVDHRYSPEGRVAYYGEGWENGPDFQLPGRYVEEAIPGTTETLSVPEYAYLDEYRFPVGTRAPSPVATLKAIDCYEYQSCEHAGWKDSEAKRFCEALRDDMITRLPGYSEASWGISS